MTPTVLLALALDPPGATPRPGRDEAAVEALLALAPRLGVQRVVALHARGAAPLPPALRRLLPPPTARVPVELRAHGDALRAALPDVQVDLVAHDGDLAQAVAQEVARVGPDLLVLGRAAGTPGSDRLGDNGRRLLRGVACTQLVVPAGAPPPGARAVVGMDLSDHALAALELAQAVFDEVRCVFQFDPRHHPPGAMTEIDFARHMAQNAQDTLDEALRGTGRPLPPLDVQPASDPAEALVAAAGRAATLVVGSRGLSPLASAVLGSTAEHLAGRCEGPLLIVRRKGASMGLVEGIVRR